MSLDLQKYSLLLILFSLITSFGYVFTRRILKENKVIYLIPLSVCFGSSFFVVLLHLISLIIGVYIATYISLLFITLITLLIIFKYKISKKLDYELSKKQLLLLCSFSLFLTLLAAWHLISFGTYDTLSHCIGPITKQTTYPPPHSYSPETKSAYHYGVILFGSAINIFSTIEVWNSLIPIQALFTFITPIAIFSLVFSVTKKFLQSMLGSVIGCFCANLTFLNIFSLQKSDFNGFISNLHSKLVLMNESGFAVSTSKSFISPNMSVALPLSIVLFYLCTKEKNTGRYLWFAIFFISAFLFFSYEAFWFPVIASVLLYYLMRFIVVNRSLNQLKSTVLLVTAILLSPSLVGGVFTHSKENITNLLYFDLKSYIFSWSGILGEIYNSEWLSSHQVISHGDGASFYKVPFISKYFFVEFGLPLILLPLSIIWTITKVKNKSFIFFLISGIISFLVPFFINYIPREVEPLRFFIYARFVFSILLGAFLGYLFSIKSPSFIKIFSQICICILIIALITPGIVWFIPKKICENDYRYTHIPYPDKLALKWLHKKVKAGDRGFGPTNIPHQNFELVTVAGVYGISLFPNHWVEKSTRQTILETLNPCLLKELKIKWIYLNNDLLSKINKTMLKKLIKEGLLTLRYKQKYKDEIRLVYEFKPPKKNKYCKDKNYVWLLGELKHGTFTPFLNTNSQTTFTNKDSALRYLKGIKDNYKQEKSYWYRVEAVKI